MKPRIKYWPEAGCWTMEAPKGRKLSKQDYIAFQQWAAKLTQKQ